MVCTQLHPYNHSCTHTSIHFTHNTATEYMYISNNAQQQTNRQQSNKHTQQIHMHSQPYLTLSIIVEYPDAIISVAMVNIKACCMSNILHSKHGWSRHVQHSDQSELGLYAGKFRCQSSCSSSSFLPPTLLTRLYMKHFMFVY